VEQGGQQPQVGRDRGLEREQVQDPPLDIQVEGVHFVIAAYHLIAGRQVAAHEGLQRLFQQDLGLGGCLLDLVLKGAQLFGEALARLGHQPTLLCCGLGPRALGCNQGLPGRACLNQRDPRQPPPGRATVCR